MNISFLSDAILNRAYLSLIKNRAHFPPNSDIWHLRFHWAHVKQNIKTRLSQGRYLLRPLQLVQKSDNTQVALWSAEDALVITMLTLYLTPQLPLHKKCEHIKGHKGGKSSIHQVHSIIKQSQYNYICRTDIKGYYANINKSRLLSQLKHYVSDPMILDLLAQFLYYTVEDGGNFHTPKKGIARSSSLSQLLAAFHLYCIDDYFAKQAHLYYVRYMDDFIILTKSRWHLKRAVATLNHFFTDFGFKQHPDKTFIGRIAKGFDWMGFWFTDFGCTEVAPRAYSNHVIKLNRLYEQVQKLPADLRAIRMMSYLTRWERWKNNILIPLTSSQPLLEVLHST